jgi:hypothetical protein
MNAFAMAQAASDLGSGGAGREGDGIAFGDHVGGGDGDTALLVGEALFAERKGCVEAEGFVGKLAGELDTSVGAMDKSPLLELDEIATDAGGRGVDSGSEVFYATGALLQEQMKDLICTIVCLCSHLDVSFQWES